MHLREERVGINKMTWGLYVLHIRVCACSRVSYEWVVHAPPGIENEVISNTCIQGAGTAPAPLSGRSVRPQPSRRALCEPSPQGPGAEGVTQLLGRVVSSHCSTEIRPPFNILPLFWAFCLLLSWHAKQKLLRGLQRRGKCKRESGDDRGEVCQSKWPSRSPALLNGKYGMGPVPICIWWDPPINSARSLQEFLPLLSSSSRVFLTCMLTRCPQINGVWGSHASKFSSAALDEL